MAKKLYEEETIRGIANKIREKANTNEQYSTDDMAEGIEAVYENGYTEGNNSVPTQYGGVIEQVVPQKSYSIGPCVSMSYEFSEPVKIDPAYGSTISLVAPFSDFGNAQTDDVTEGVTFTAAGGFQAVGTGKRLSEEDEAEINTQAELIAQIKETAETLPDAGEGGNSSSDSIVGIWVLNNTLNYAPFGEVPLEFISNGIRYSRFMLYGDQSYVSILYGGDEENNWVYDGEWGYGYENNKVIEILEESYDSVFTEWLKNNATRSDTMLDYIAYWNQMLGDQYTEVGGGGVYDEETEEQHFYAPTSVLARDNDDGRCIILPQGIQAEYSALYDLIVIPRSIENIVELAFEEAPFCTVVCLATTPPTLGWQGYWSSDGGSSPPTAIYVPDESVDLYKNDTTWAEYAYRIVPISTFIYSASFEE